MVAVLTLVVILSAELVQDVSEKLRELSPEEFTPVREMVSYLHLTVGH